MKVTSNYTIDFPTLGWSIQAGEVKDLPESKEAQEAILENTYIREAPSEAKESAKKSETKQSSSKSGGKEAEDKK